MTDPFSTPPVEIARDHWGRPMVVPPGGGKATPYTRCTTFVGVLEDTYNLSRWQQRMVAIGLNDRPDLAIAVSAHRDDKVRLSAICDEAMEAAKAHAGCDDRHRAARVDRAARPRPAHRRRAAECSC
jgi:hypothetical protein